MPRALAAATRAALLLTQMALLPALCAAEAAESLAVLADVFVYSHAAHKECTQPQVQASARRCAKDAYT